MSWPRRSWTSMEEHAALLRTRSTRSQRRPGDRRWSGRARRLRRRAGALGDLHGRTRQHRVRAVAIGEESWPGVTVWTDHPAVSCMASQYAGWAISVDKFFAMGSGPSGRMPGSRRSCSRSWAMKRRPSTACWCWRDARCRPKRWQNGWPKRPGSRPTGLPSSSRPRPVSPAGSRSRHASWRRAFTRWSRSASTCGG